VNLCRAPVTICGLEDRANKENEPLCVCLRRCERDDCGKSRGMMLTTLEGHRKKIGVPQESVDAMLHVNWNEST